MSWLGWVTAGFRNPWGSYALPMTWSVAHTMPASTAAERLAAWEYLRDTFFATTLAGWTKTTHIDSAATPERFSISTDVTDLVTGDTITNHYWITNDEFVSSDFTRWTSRIAHYTSASYPTPEDAVGQYALWDRVTATGDLLTVADPSHAGFKFMVSDENNKAFCITLNNRLFMFHLGVKEIYVWGNDQQWLAGNRIGYRSAPVEDILGYGSEYIFGYGGTVTGSDSYSELIVPGIYFWNDNSFQGFDHAFSRFPLLYGTSTETDDDNTNLFGFSPASDVTWVRVLNQPVSGSTPRYFLNNNAEPYHVARQLNGDYVLFWRDLTVATEPYAMLNFGPNDPS